MYGAMKVMFRRICPRCGTSNIHRSSQSYGLRWTRLMRLMFVVPYRCHDCNSTHFGWKFLV